MAASAPTYAESQRHLILDTDDDAASLASYRPDSIYDSRQSIQPESSQATPRASEIGDHRPISPSDIEQRPRYGSVGQYTSEDAYLDALRSWVTDKQYYKPGELTNEGSGPLEGFYGKTTMADYASRPRQSLRGERKKRKEEEKENKRRATVADIADKGDDGAKQEVEKQRRKSSIGDLLRRQRTR